MEADDSVSTALYEKFTAVKDEYRRAVIERFDASEALAEAMSCQRAADHEVAVRKSLVAARPEGKNAGERNAYVLIQLQADPGYQSLLEESKDQRSAVADLQRRVEMLQDEIRGEREHMRFLAGVVTWR
tara:strand:- start:592 stop:978 length:387 start_codon:yes stop_codon:yes gene_type:complete